MSKRRKVKQVAAQLKSSKPPKRADCQYCGENLAKCDLPNHIQAKHPYRSFEGSTSELNHLIESLETPIVNGKRMCPECFSFLVPGLFVEHLKVTHGVSRVWHHAPSAHDSGHWFTRPNTPFWRRR